VECGLETERSKEGNGERKCPMCKEEENDVHIHLKYSEVQKWGEYG
jgi:hypothetical protein